MQKYILISKSEENVGDVSLFVLTSTSFRSKGRFQSSFLIPFCLLSMTCRAHRNVLGLHASEAIIIIIIIIILITIIIKIMIIITINNNNT